MSNEILWSQASEDGKYTAEVKQLVIAGHGPVEGTYAWAVLYENEYRPAAFSGVVRGFDRAKDRALKALASALVRRQTTADKVDEYTYDSTDVNEVEGVVIYSVPAGTEVKTEADASEHATSVRWEHPTVPADVYPQTPVYGATKVKNPVE